jgi:hypothetical protein
MNQQKNYTNWLANFNKFLNYRLGDHMKQYSNTILDIKALKELSCLSLGTLKGAIF